MDKTPCRSELGTSEAMVGCGKTIVRLGVVPRSDIAQTMSEVEGSGGIISTEGSGKIHANS